ncbi:hypothetical protein SAMN06309944_1124 [Micrococcales bacterium KH10]|nr:hypothetical protein SAMN06309944_1124 [Micrococcales bacterium KH10]
MKIKRGSAPAVLEAQRDYLVIPAHSDIMDLVAARYEDAAWLVTPEQAAASRQVAQSSGGARFRGAASVTEPVDAQLALSDDLILTGPTELSAQQAQAMGLGAVDHQLFMLPAGSSLRHEALMAWAVAAARHCGGAVWYASGELERPDPEALVALRLFSPDPQPMGIVLEVVRSVLPRAQNYLRDDGSEALYTTSEYDGIITVTRDRAGRDLPSVLATVNWRDFGPHIYEVSWIPPEAMEIDPSDSSSLTGIARRRVAPMIAKAVILLRERFDGTVLDSDDFLVRPGDLEQRAKGR